ncbi:MAG: glutathione peroxidase [Nitrospira sp.]|nr:glutathione peroxidase [Nitrospira sp.]
MKRFFQLSLMTCLTAFALLILTIIACNPGYAAETATGGAAMAPVYGFTLNDIDGNPLALNTFTGKVLLLVNTASMCGNTPQYEGLQTLYEQYREQGLEILAFPANNFGKQEPGTNEEIKSFCYTKYALEFPLFSKISVKGEDMHPLYHYLTAQSPFPGEIEWNFQKFLVNRQGEVIARYRPGLKPLSAQIVQDIEQALDKS